MRKDRANTLGNSILNLVTWPASLVPGLLVHKNVTGIVQLDLFDRAAAKTAVENGENIKLDVSLNRKGMK